AARAASRRGAGDPRALRGRDDPAAAEDGRVPQGLEHHPEPVQPHPGVLARRAPFRPRLPDHGLADGGMGAGPPLRAPVSPHPRGRGLHRRVRGAGVDADAAHAGCRGALPRAEVVQPAQYGRGGRAPAHRARRARRAGRGLARHRGDEVRRGVARRHVAADGKGVSPKEKAPAEAGAFLRLQRGGGGLRRETALLYAEAPTFLRVSFAAVVTAVKFASAISVACLATLVKLSYAELAAASADLTAATATSEPAGAFFDTLSRKPTTFRFSSADCASMAFVSSAWD